MQDAVNRPRFHHQWLPDTIALLESRGHKIRRVSTQGEVAAILFDGGYLQGAPDPRVEATAEGF